MKKAKYYVCKTCNNLVIATGESEIYCCGKHLESLEPKKPDSFNDISIEVIELDYYISSNHPMVKDHYISFMALSSGDRIEVIKKYPEWDFEARLPKLRHGMLLWYCTKDGLFYKNI